MFSVLLTAAIAIGANPSVAASPGRSVDNPANAGVVFIIDDAGQNCVTCNCADRGSGRGSGLSCDCIRSSANYPWNWLVSMKKICQPLQISQCGSPPWGARSCPAYYGLYDRPYDFRRAHDYQWRSPSYRPRSAASRGANYTRGCIGTTKPGDGVDELVPTPEVLVVPETP